MSVLQSIVRPSAFWRVLFYAAVAVVVVLSLLPAPDLPPLPDISDKAQHALAYLALGFLAGLAHRRRNAHVAAAAGLVLLGGAIEIAQSWSPGRMAEWGDFLADAAGVAAGAVLLRGLILRRFSR